MNIISVLTLKDKDMLIKCKKCGKTIEKKGNREYCIPCRNILDKERIRERTQTEEYKRIHREKYRMKKEGLL